MNKGIIYYTDNQLDLVISKRVQDRLLEMNLPIVSASLEPIDFGKNIHLPLVRSIPTMYKQILAALEASETYIIFFCEHDVLYHPSHFEFTPPEHGIPYYNTNVWKVRYEDGHSLWVDNCIQVSGLCGYRDEFIEHYKERVALSEAGPWDKNWGYEPGTPGKTIFKTLLVQGTWLSPFPNIDIRHNHNLTYNRWTQDKFRDKRNCRGWTEKNVNEIEGWKDLVLK